MVRCWVSSGFTAIRSTEKSPLPIRRFTAEADRLLGVMDKRLAETEYLAGADYSIADIAAYPWTLAATEFLGDVLSDCLKTKPAVHRWLKTVGDRTAVKRGMEIPKV
jgi:GST-like protein